MGKGYSPEQIVRKLRDAEAKLPKVARELGISEATFHRWRRQYGGMNSQEAKRLKELEKENARLKKLLAEQALDIDLLKEVSRGTSEHKARRRGAMNHLQEKSFCVSERRACRVADQRVSQVAEGQRVIGQVSDQDYKDAEQPRLRLDLRVCEVGADEDGHEDEPLCPAFSPLPQSRSSGFLRVALEDEGGLLLLNPGSPTDKRRQPEHTFALLTPKEEMFGPRS